MDTSTDVVAIVGCWPARYNGWVRHEGIGLPLRIAGLNARRDFISAHFAEHQFRDGNPLGCPSRQ